VAVIVLQPLAKADLAEIWEFIADDSVDQADGFIDLIDQKFQVLAQRTGIGRKRDELVEGLRSFSVGRYVIFYLAIPGDVQIVRVLHGARDIELGGCLRPAAWCWSRWTSRAGCCTSPASRAASPQRTRSGGMRSAPSRHGSLRAPA